MTAKPLPWNLGSAAGKEEGDGSSAPSDCYGTLELQQSSKSAMFVWCEFDAQSRTLEWHDRDSKRTVTVTSLGAAPKAHLLKITDVKQARELARKAAKSKKGGGCSVGRPAPLGSLPLSARAHLRFLTEDDVEDAAESVERVALGQDGGTDGHGSHNKHGHGPKTPSVKPLAKPPANAFVLHLGRRAVTFKAPNPEAFAKWKDAMAPVVGMVNDDRSSSTFKPSHLFHMCGACEAFSVADTAKAVANDVTHKPSSFTGRTPRGGSTTLGGVDFYWQQAYESSFSKNPDGETTDEGTDETPPAGSEFGGDTDDDYDDDYDDGSGGSGGGSDDWASDDDYDDSEYGGSSQEDGGTSDRRRQSTVGEALWCELCGVTVPTASSLACHMRMCARRQASSSTECPTCRYSIPTSELTWHIAHACNGPPDSADRGMEPHNYPYPSPWPHSNPTPTFLAAMRRYGPGRGRIVAPGPPLPGLSIMTTAEAGKEGADSAPNPRAPHGRAPCAVCGRRFVLHRLREHQDICIKLKRGRPAPPPAMRSQYARGNVAITAENDSKAKEEPDQCSQARAEQREKVLAMSPEEREAHATAVEVVSKNGAALSLDKFKAYRRDRDVVLAAVKQHGFALEEASKELRGDREIVLAAMASAGQGVLRFASWALRGFERDERTGKMLPRNDPELEATARRRRLRVGKLTWRELNRDVASRGARSAEDGGGGGDGNNGKDEGGAASLIRHNYVPSTETIVPNSLSTGSGAFTVTKYRWVMAIWQRLVRLALSGLPLQRLLVFMHSEKKAIAELQTTHLAERKRRGEGGEGGGDETAEKIRFAQWRLLRLQSSSILKAREDEVSRLRRHVMVRKPTEALQVKGPPKVECACCGMVIAVPNLADHQRGNCHGVKVYDSAAARVRGLGADFPESMDTFRLAAKAPFAPDESGGGDESAAGDDEEEGVADGDKDAADASPEKTESAAAAVAADAPDGGLAKGAEAEAALALAQAACAWERTMAGEAEVVNGCWNEPVGRPPPPQSATEQATTCVATRTLLAGTPAAGEVSVVSMVALETTGPSAFAPPSLAQPASRTVRVASTASSGSQETHYANIFRLFEEEMKPTTITRKVYITTDAVMLGEEEVEPILVQSQVLTSAAETADMEASLKTDSASANTADDADDDADDAYDANNAAADNATDAVDSQSDGREQNGEAEPDDEARLAREALLQEEGRRREEADARVMQDVRRTENESEMQELARQQREQQQQRLKEALRSAVIAHDPRGLQGIRSLWWRAWAVGKHDQHRLATDLRLRSPVLDRARRRMLQGPSLRYDASTAAALCRVAAVGFSLESDVAVTCCGAGIVDVWKMTSAGPPRLLATWSSTPSWNFPDQFREVCDARDASRDNGEGNDFSAHPPAPPPASSASSATRAVAPMPCNGWDGEHGRCRYGAACRHRATQLVGVQEVKSEDGRPGEGRAGIPVEGLVVDRKGERALLCLGPRRPRPKRRGGTRYHASKLGQYPAWEEDTERPPARSRLIFLDLGTGRVLRTIARAHPTPVAAMAVSTCSSTPSDYTPSSALTDDGEDVVATVASGDYSHVKIWRFPPLAQRERGEVEKEGSEITTTQRRAGAAESRQ